MRRTLRTAAAVLAAALALAGLTVAPAHAGGSRAVVIVDTGSGTYTRVISFDGTISGYDALVLAGAGPTTYGFSGQGVAVCQLFGVGNPADGSCLGTGGDPSYWAYYRAPAGSGGWQYSRGGAGATTVSDGDVEGWRFGAGGAPGFRSFCDVAGCGPPPAPVPEEAPAPAPAPPPGANAGGAAAGGAPTGDGAAASSGEAAAVIPTDGSVDPAGAGSVTPTTAAEDAGAARGGGRSTGADRRALGARPVVADDAGSGSPIGVLVAVGLVALIAGVALVLRRRARASD